MKIKNLTNMKIPGIISILMVIMINVTDGQRTDPGSILAIMKKVCDWQLANLKDTTINRAEKDRKEYIRPNGWVRAAFYSGVLANYYATGEQKYLDSVISWAERNKYLPGPSPRHADDQAAGQVYTELYFLTKDQKYLDAIRRNYDLMISDPMRGPAAGWSKSLNWAWCDALFMAPPGMARMGYATGDPKYFDLLDTLWWDTHEYLFDKSENLYYRDSNYILNKNGKQLLSPSGKKIFWARGNGWVMAGLARTIQYLPENYPDRSKFVDLYKKMASSIRRFQGKDGLWRASLNDPLWYPEKETSSTGMFCFSLAWGINSGLLDKDEYLPVVIKAWKGLVRCVDVSGKLGYVQVTGHDPRPVFKTDNVEYGAGAFLLAGEQVLKIK